MKNSRVILLIEIFCLVSFAAGIVNSAHPSADSAGCQDTLLATTNETKKISADDSVNSTLIDEDTQANADSKAGTCPKGFHCSCPGCPLYSDLDEDKFCDLGEEE